MIEFVQYDPKELLDKLIKSVENGLNTVLYPGDERRIFLQQLLPVLLSQRAEINYTGNQNLLSTARDGYLDNIGDMFDVERIPSQHAQCKVQYSISEPLMFDVIIPKGSRITPDGVLVFSTVKEAVISASNLSVEVMAKADIAGVQCNDLLPSQICNMIDVIPFVTKAVNITVSSGGTDIESDSNYRDRIRLSYQQHSTAGSEDSYIFWAKSAGNDIADVKVSSPSDGIVNVYVLPYGATEASEELIDRVESVLASDKHRPLTDHVNVLSADAFNYNIKLTYYINRSDEAKATVIQQNVDKAIAEFAMQTSQKLGNNINPDLLRSLLYNAGIYTADVLEPSFTKLTANQVGVMLSKQITFGGVK